MKRFTYFLALLGFVFLTGCNSAEKPKEDTTNKDQISVEHLVEVTIPVRGMTCEGCENAVKKSVSSLAGVSEVTASHVDSVAVVKYDESLTNIEDIKEKIADAGYIVPE